MIRIVFVDDETNVLQAMRRTMHSMRTEWSMEFVSSGAAALETLHHTPSLATGDGLGLPGLIHIANRLVHQGDDQGSGASDRVMCRNGRRRWPHYTKERTGP
jgi:hypothetical protein